MTSTARKFWLWFAPLAVALIGLGVNSVPAAAELRPMGGATPFLSTSEARPGMFVAVRPSRILDTRTGMGGSAAGPMQTLSVMVNGRGGVPTTGVASVVMNVTAVAPRAGGYLTMFAHLTTRPAASNLNFSAGQTVSNQAIATLGADGRVAIFNGSGSPVQLVVDVSGYYVAGTPRLPGSFTAVTPTRIVDTRAGLGGHTVPSQDVLDLIPARTLGLQSVRMSAMVINVTVTGSTSSGYLAAWDATLPQPATSTMNFTAGTTVSHLMTVADGASGLIRLYNGSRGSVQLIVDVVGFVRNGVPGISGGMAMTDPTRVLDTRRQLGGAALGAQAEADVRVTGVAGVPATGVSAVLLNVTAVAPQSSGYLSVWPSGAVRPTASSVNFSTGSNVSNQVIVPVGADGRVSLYNGSVGPVHVLVDLVGYVVHALPPVRGTAGTVKAWGLDSEGALGDGPSVAPVATVTTVTGLGSVVAVAGGGLSEYAMKSDGTVWAWGPNSQGELGNGNFSGTSSPVQVVGLTDAVAIAGGNYTGYAVKADGTVWAWGTNFLGELGDDHGELHSSSPVRVKGLTDVVAVAAGAAGTAYALKSDGTVWAWGYNFYGAVGDGTHVDKATPVRVGVLNGVRAIAGGGNTGYALMSDGTVQAWGTNGSGQLGIGTAPGTSLTPVAVKKLADVKAIAADGYTAYALTKDGTVHAWGNNVHGQLGNGTTDTISVLPVQVSDLTNVTSIGAGYDFAYASLSDGTVWAWGNGEGALGQGTSGDLSVPGPVHGLPQTLTLSGNIGCGYAVLR